MTAQARKLRGHDGEQQSGQDRQNSEQPVSWLELFFDLVFVAAFDRLIQRLGEHLDLQGFGVFVLLFAALWWAWLGNTNFAARYGNACRAYRWGTLAQMLALAALAVSVRGDLEDTGQFFALAYAAGRAVLIGMLLVYGRSQGHASPGERRLDLGFVLGALLWFGSAFVSGPAQIGLWVLALATDVLSTLLSERRHDRELPHQGHFPERVGLLFIVALGAVVTELVRGSAEQPLTLEGQLPSVLAFVTIIALWRLYFDESHTLPALLAGRTGKAHTLLAWTYTHLPLMLALGVLSSGFETGIAEEGAAAGRHERLIVGGALAAIFVSLALLRAFSARPLGSDDRQSSGETDPELKTAFRRAGLPRRSPLLSLSGLTRLGAAALLLLLTRASLDTLAYQAVCMGVAVVVAYVSWLDPLQEKLAKIESELSESQSPEDPSAAETDDQSENDQSPGITDPDRSKEA